RSEAPRRRAARRGDNQPVVTARTAQLLRGSHACAAARAGDARAARASGWFRGDRDSLPERARRTADRARRSGDRVERPPPQRAPVRAARLRARGAYLVVIRIHTFVTHALQTRTTFRPRLSVGGSGGIQFVGRVPREASR